MASLLRYKLMRLREEMLWRDPPTWYGLPVSRSPGHPVASDQAPDQAPYQAPDQARCPSTADAPHADSEGCAARAGGGLGPIEPAAGFLVYEPRIEATWLARPPLSNGGIPTHHLTIMLEQLRQLRNAFFLARARGRALVLPTVTCTCEMGFFIYHIKEDCRAPDHPTLHLPYACSLDHDPLVAP